MLLIIQLKGKYSDALVFYPFILAFSLRAKELNGGFTLKEI